MLESRSISMHFGKKCVLDDVSMTLREGRIMAVLGPSGSGKTTLLRVLLGLDLPDSGTVTWNQTLLSEGRRLAVPTEHRNFGMVFQDASLFPHLDVIGNVAFGIGRRPREERTRRALSWMERLGIVELRRRDVHALSGGERQRVALARALAAEPRLLLLDEPFSSVDRLVRQELITTLKRLFLEAGTTVLLVTHDARDAYELASDVLLLREGRSIQQGTLAEVTDSPANAWVQSFLSAGR